MRLALLLRLVAMAMLMAPAASWAEAAPVGMVEQPCPAGTAGRSAGMEAFGRAMVQDGPVDMGALMKTYGKDIADNGKAEAEHAKVDWPNLCLYRAADDAAKPGETRVVFLGDSITELWRAADPDLFTHGIANRGISGQTSPQALLRFYADVVALHPRIVHIMIGTNDVAGNTGPSRPEDYKNNIRAMVQLAKANHIAVILASIPPASGFAWRRELHPAQQIKTLNIWLADYAREQGLVYADYYAVLAGPDGGMKPGISRDGVHPLISGYALMKPTAEGAINRANIISRR